MPKSILIRFYLLLLIVAIFFIAQTSHSFAHTIAVDNSISVLMHIDPDDQPVAQDPATLHFEVDDPSSKFNIKNCTCIVTISINGKDLSEHKVSPYKNGKSIYDAYLPYVFPKIGVYTIEFRAKPTVANLFTPFTVHYDVRVDSEDTLFSQFQSQFSQITERIPEGFYICVIIFLLIILFKVLKS